MTQRRLSATHWTIVQAAQAGDDDAIRELVLKYRPAVVRYLQRRGLSSEAEDVAQEVLFGLVAKALRNADRRAGSFRGLVFALARNLLAKHLEKLNAKKRGAGRTVPLGEHDPAQEEPDEEFDREWLSALVRAGLAKLEARHPNYFVAVQRSVLDGQPQAQIAADLGISVGALKKHVHRGKRKLAGYLREEVWSYACSRKEYETEVRYLAQLLGPSDMFQAVPA